MAEPYAILCVPTEAGAALLDMGPCCSFPPVADRGWDGKWYPADPEYRHSIPEPDEVQALPLWWAGALVPEGWDRARRVAFATHPAWMMTTIMEPDMQQLLMVARFLEKHRLCRVVVLDLHEGVPVERAP